MAYQPLLFNGFTTNSGSVNGMSNPSTADLNMNSHKITNVTNPTNPQDAATKNYIDTKISFPATNNEFVNSGPTGSLTGQQNVAVGVGAGISLTAGNFNTYIGYNAGNLATAMDSNVAIGNSACAVLTTGSSSTVVGAAAGVIITTGSGNTLFGTSAGDQITTGGGNVCIGALSGRNVSTGTFNIFIGQQASTTSSSADHQIAIGTSATVSRDNSIVLGRSADNVSVGLASPLARLHLPAGTATANTAPLKIDSGVKLSVAEAGAIEFDGTNLFYTDSTPSRKTIATTPGDLSARAFSSTTTISGSLATIVYATEDFDPSNSYDNTTGIYTASVAGKYEVNVGLLITGTVGLNNTLVVEIQKNGTVVSRYTEFFPAGITDGKAGFSDIINCAANDTIKIRASSSVTSPSIVSSNFDNYLSIAKVF